MSDYNGKDQYKSRAIPGRTARFALYNDYTNPNPTTNPICIPNPRL